MRLSGGHLVTLVLSSAPGLPRRLVDIMECRKQGINIGYCPQVDALDDLLTGEEHLYFYGRIRGISKRQLDAVRKKLSLTGDVFSKSPPAGWR